MNPYHLSTPNTDKVAQNIRQMAATLMLNIGKSEYKMDW